MLDQNNKEYFDLNGKTNRMQESSKFLMLLGALVYDGCIGKYDTVAEDITVVPFMQKNQQYFSGIDLASFASKHQQCGYDSYINTYLQFPPSGPQPPIDRSSNGCDLFNQAYSAAQGANSCFNIYEVNQTCPTPNDSLQPTYGQGQAYFDRSDVKAAMHAPSVTWSECSNQNVFTGGYNNGPEGEGDLSPDPIQGVLPQVIDGTNRMLVANGDLDMIIITDGSLLSIQNMTWGGQLGFQSKPSTPIVTSEGTKGIQHFERGLMWTETYGSGHMGPQYQPLVAYKQLQWVLGRIDSL
jgi:carboxypeptidase D